MPAAPESPATRIIQCRLLRPISSVPLSQASAIASLTTATFVSLDVRFSTNVYVLFVGHYLARVQLDTSHLFLGRRRFCPCPWWCSSGWPCPLRSSLCRRLSRVVPVSVQRRDIGFCHPATLLSPENRRNGFSSCRFLKETIQTASG
jgi:hypothetical protein